MRRQGRLRRLHLSLMFAVIVFLILLMTLIVTALGSVALRRLGVIPEDALGRVPLFYFALVSLVIGTLLAFMLSGKPLEPLNKVMDATDRIAAGDYSVRLDLKRPQEMRQLAQKFNHMAQELASVEILRNDFVRDFSHEFKTPIASIRGFARALKWEGLSPEERNEYLDIIIAEAERLSNLSQNVLYLSKVESQAILTGTTRFNLSEQIRLVVALLDEKIEAKRIDIAFEGDEYFVEGNEEMLRQVWINLLDNAIKFCPEGGRIEIRLAQGVAGTVVSVFNQGDEIPLAVRERIFDKFYQADSSHKTAGNGLGLAIVKRIVGLHGGSIAVRSSDKGSTFEVALPG